MSTKAMVIVAGTDKFHDVIGGGEAIQQALLEAGCLASLRLGLDRFDEDSFCEADAFVVNAMRPRPAAKTQEQLARRVEHGAGVVVLHASNVSVDPDGQRKWLELIGSRFDRHGPFRRLSVEIDSADHPITRGLERFEIDDEPYEVSWTGEPPEVLASVHQEGRTLPMVYVRGHGKGRVCYIALGHDMRAWGHPAFRKLVVRATAWAAGDEST